MKERVKLELPTMSFGEGILLEGKELIEEGFKGVDGPEGMEGVEDVD